MSVREILVRGDPVLNKVAHRVERFDRRLGLLLDDMKETLAHAHGLGLAAPQVGILRRAIVVADIDTGEMLELVNPEIVDKRGEQTGFEGCLSVPNLWGIVTRPQWVKVIAQDRHGEFFEVTDEGINARCLCHEVAHLNGHLYTELTDRLYTPDEMDAILEEQEKREQEKEEQAGKAHGAAAPAPEEKA